MREYRFSRVGEVYVSLQCAILILKCVDLWFGTDEVLVPAKHLTVINGIVVAPTQELTYIHITCEAHELVEADGAWKESFLPADPARLGIDNPARTELAAIFPEFDPALLAKN